MRLLITLSIVMIAPLSWGEDNFSATPTTPETALERNAQAGFPEPPTVITTPLPQARIQIEHGPLEGYWVNPQTQELYERERSETPLPCGESRIALNRVQTFGSSNRHVRDYQSRLQTLRDKMSGNSCDMVFHRAIRDIRTTSTPVIKRCTRLESIINDRWFITDFEYFQEEVLENFRSQFPNQLEAFQAQVAATVEGSQERHQLFANAYGIFNADNRYQRDLLKLNTAQVDYDVLDCDSMQNEISAYKIENKNIANCNNLGKEVQLLQEYLVELRDQARMEAESQAAFNACLSEQLGRTLTPQRPAQGSLDSDQEGVN